MNDGPLIVQSDKTLLLEVDHELARECRAAITLPASDLSDQMTAFDRTLDGNLRAVYRCCAVAIPHMKREPIGMLVLPLLTAMTQGWAIGWASAPYDPYWANRYPNRAALMAAAPMGVAFDCWPPVFEYTSVSSTRTLTSRPCAST